MQIFLLLFVAWITVPALLCWSLSFSAMAVTLAVLVSLLLPLLLQAVIVRQVTHPPWHIPGKQPKEEDEAAFLSAAPSLSPPVEVDDDTDVDAQAAREEDAFESMVADPSLSHMASVASATAVGELGKVIGGAVHFYAGKHTNPRVDFGLEYRDISIRCSAEPRVKGAAANNGSTSRTNKRKSSDEQQQRQSLSAAPRSYSLRGWLIPGKSFGGSVSRTLIVLVHGAGRDRRNFMRHSPVFHEAGYTTLLIDCREHGTSSAQGKGTGFTTREAIDIIHAARFGRDVLGFEKVVLCGTSQGAASSIVAAVLADLLEFDPIPASAAGSINVSLAAPVSPVSTTDSAPRSRSRSYRASMTRLGDGNASDEDAHLLDRQDESGDNSPTPVAAAIAASSSASATAASSSASSAPLIAGVISENAFCSREACVSEVIHKLLGRPLRFLSPLLLPLQRAFVAGVVLQLRWKLGLFRPWSVSSWAANWRRAQGAHETLFEFPLHAGAQRSTTTSHASPSSAHLPLPTLSASSLARCSVSSLLDASPLDLVSRIAPRPLLLMHGLRDEIVPASHSQSLYTQARDPRKLWLVADAHHTALHDADPEGWKTTVIGWLGQHGF